MRLALPLLFLLAGCDRASERATVPGGQIVPCALGAGNGFTAHCSVERLGVRGLIIHHPDGGFRRLTITDDGGVVAADGAETAQVRSGGREIEVAIGDDRYRLPATLKPRHR